MHDHLTVPSLLEKTAAITPEKIALIAASKGNITDLSYTTYGELYNKALRLANGLKELGVSPKDRVGIFIDNTCATEAHICYHAVHLIGAINVPLNTMNVAREIANAIDHAGIKAVVYDAKFNDKVEEMIKIASQKPIFIRLNSIEKDATFQSTSFSDLMDYAPLNEPETIKSSHHADWIFTSGTTGAPKMACFSHAACVAAGHQVANGWSLNYNDIYQSSSPFFTSTGCHTNLLGTLSAGCTYLIDPDVELANILDRAEKFNTSVCFLITSLLKLLIRDHSQLLYKIQKIRRIIYGGMAMPDEFFIELDSVISKGMNIELMHLMGFTEGGPTGLFLEPTMHRKKPGSVGNKAFSEWSKFCILDDTGNEIQQDGTGELCWQSPSAAQVYLNQDGSFEPLLKKGWICTGDLVRRDKEGFVYFVDRKKDNIRRGGFNISSAEIENILKLFPGVKDASVVPKEHPVLGEDICAFILCEKTVDINELKQHCENNLSKYKVPRDIRVVDEFPRNGMGRVIKAALRQMANNSTAS